MIQAARRFSFVVFMFRRCCFPVGVLFFRFAVFPLGDRPGRFCFCPLLFLRYIFLPIFCSEGRACFVLFVLLRCVLRCWIMTAFISSSVVASSVALLGLFEPIYIIPGVMGGRRLFLLFLKKYFIQVIFPVRVLFTSCKNGLFCVVYGFSFSVQYMECIKFMQIFFNSRKFCFFECCKP